MGNGVGRKKREAGIWRKGGQKTDGGSPDKIKIIYDSDNTMGLPEHDVDDGLALLYLLGREDIELAGITTTFGNDTTDVVYSNTKRMLQEIGHEDIEILMGGAKDDRNSPSAEFLVSQVNDNIGELTILAVGAPANLYGAYEMDNEFFDKVKEVVIMGGLTEPMIIGGQELSLELNFSSDPEAAYNVLNSTAPITVITGNLCLNAFFGGRQFKRLEQKQADIPIYSYILTNIYPFRDFWKKIFGEDGFYLWDVVAAVYVTHPELFNDDFQKIISTVEDMQSGNLKIGSDNFFDCNTNIPSSIVRLDQFEDAVFQAWANVP